MKADRNPTHVMSRSPRVCRQQICTAVIAAALIAGLPGRAHADAIDGNWCGPTGKLIVIDGPAVTTPAGNAIIRDYSRHAFSYDVPESEPEAGGTVFMSLMNDDLMRLSLQPAGATEAGEGEFWRRCKPIS